MARMTFEAVTAEGKRISGNLELMEQLICSPSTIKAQADQIRANGDKQSAKLRALTMALDLPCLDCNHPRMSHDRGMAHCGEGSVVNGVVSHCPCIGWVIEFS